MATGVKIGRSAHELLRDDARDLAELCRIVNGSPDGNYCANPDDQFEEQTWISRYQMLNYVAAYLERFAENGSFQFPINMRKFSVREEYRSVLEKGMSRTEAIDMLMKKHNMSKSVVERTIKVDQQKVEASKERAAKAEEVGAATAKAWTAKK